MFDRPAGLAVDPSGERIFVVDTGGGKLDSLLKGLQKALEVGFKPIKINIVVMKDTPIDEYQRVMEYCMRHGFTLRFIETMPMGTPGRNASEQYLSLKKVRQLLDRQYDLLPGLMLFTI